MEKDSLGYNVFTGRLPEELQLQRVKEVFGLILRDLPTR